MLTNWSLKGTLDGMLTNRVNFDMTNGIDKNFQVRPPECWEAYMLWEEGGGHTSGVRSAIGDRNGHLVEMPRRRPRCPTKPVGTGRRHVL